MPRLTFWQVFKQVDDDTLEALKKIKLGAVELDKGATITRGTIIAGIDLFKYFNSELETEKRDDTWVIETIIYNEQ